MNLEEVSVVIPTYNSLQFLRRTVCCLERQKMDPGLFEVVIVSDGSTDGTNQWLKEYSGSLNLIAILNDKNNGRSFARNSGAERAERKILLFLDGDMEFDQNFVSGHAQNIRKDNDVVIGAVKYPPDLKNLSYGKYLESRGVMKLKKELQIPGRYFLSGNASLTRDFFFKTGGFDEELRKYGEDIDFGVRLEKLGAEFHFDPALTVCHLHLRSQSDLIQNSHNFGRFGIPILVKKHPELKRELKLDFFDRSLIHKMIKIFGFNELMFSIVKLLVIILNKIHVPALFYSYLIFFSYFKGYKTALEQNKSA